MLSECFHFAQLKKSSGFVNSEQSAEIPQRISAELFLLMNLEQKYYICSYKLKHNTMAIISMFYGIIISMYYLDNKQHNLPHIHVKYQDEEAVISIIDGQLLEGTLKPNKMKLVQAWIEIHNEELMADWALAISGETIFKIDPLK